jgi:ketosteroid isomerase-like protein
MSQENVERVVAGYEAFNRGDLDAVAEGLSPDFELRMPPIVPDPETYRGPDGMRQLHETWGAGFDDFHVEIEEVIDAGDKVLVMAAVCGTGRDSGAEVRSPSFPHIWTFLGGEIIRMEPRPNRNEGLKAIGRDG